MFFGYLDSPKQSRNGLLATEFSRDPSRVGEGMGEAYAEWQHGRAEAV
jgi:hypothetical protein